MEIEWSQKNNWCSTWNEFTITRHQSCQKTCPAELISRESRDGKAPLMALYKLYLQSNYYNSSMASQGNVVCMYERPRSVRVYNTLDYSIQNWFNMYRKWEIRNWLSLHFLTCLEWYAPPIMPGYDITIRLRSLVWNYVNAVTGCKVFENIAFSFYKCGIAYSSVKWYQSIVMKRQYYQKFELLFDNAYQTWSLNPESTRSSMSEKA
jgi:hypothetical protein